MSSFLPLLKESAEKEWPTPINSNIIGSIPEWIKGSLYRNGPSKFEVGDTRYLHYFDGLSMITRFAIENKTVSLQCVFLKSDTYNKNVAANRIVVSEFGTGSFPDPCKNIFSRFVSNFTEDLKPTDNTLINVFPIHDELFAATETNLLNRINPATLERIEKVDITNYVAVNTATAHPHIDNDGTVHNLGMSFSLRGAAYCLIKIGKRAATTSATAAVESPPSALAGSAIVAKIAPRWTTQPTYLHSFGMSENYYVIMESALVVDVVALIGGRMTRSSYNSALKWQTGTKTRFRVVRRSCGTEVKTVFQSSQQCFVFHHINTYEENGHLIVDCISYENGDIVTQLDFRRLNENVFEQNPGRATRFVLPLVECDVYKRQSVVDADNLVRLVGCAAKAVWVDDKQTAVECTPHVLCQLPVEFGTINYTLVNSKVYRYFYCVSFAQKDRQAILKFDLNNGDCLSWSEENCYATEPIFIRQPESDEEDQGVVVTCVHVINTAVDQGPKRWQFLLFLDARSLQEIGRAEFREVSNPISLHGCFLFDDHECLQTTN